GIKCWDRLALPIQRLWRAINLRHEVREGLNSEFNPLAKIRIAERTQFQIFLCVQPRLLPEGGDGVIVETRPTLPPSIRMRHPVRNIHVNAINAGRCDLSHPFHVDLAPFGCIGSDPDILVALANPKSRATPEGRGL